MDNARAFFNLEGKSTQVRTLVGAGEEQSGILPEVSKAADAVQEQASNFVILNNVTICYSLLQCYSILLSRMPSKPQRVLVKMLLPCQLRSVLESLEYTHNLEQLSRKNRMVAFGACLVAGLACSIVGSILFVFGSVFCCIGYVPCYRGKGYADT